MTVQDAIAILEELIRCIDNQWYEISLDDDDREAFKMAISRMKGVEHDNLD